MKGVLNENTRTVHKHEPGDSNPRTVCGVSYHVARDQLQIMPVDRATGECDASRCGRCFDNSGGY